MAYRNLEFENKNHIGYITLKCPEVTLEFAHELTDICGRISEDDEIWVVLIGGSGEAFCLGTDAGDNEAQFAAEMASQAVAGLLVPVIAAINGDALGAGLELALAADIRITAEGAKFGLPQVSESAIPAGGGTQRLPRIVGRGKALEMILTAEVVDAQEAYRIGLVNKVVPIAELAACAESMATKMASKGPIAERYSKEAIGKGLDMTLGQGLRLEADLSFLLQSTKDRDEGIKAFLEKRTPEFRGE